MTLQLRPYQDEAVRSVYDHLQSRDDNPCVVIPTGGGKSLCLAQICSDAVLRWGGRVLILAHVKELLQQNADKLHRLAPDVAFGVYSAGLNSRNTKEPVIIAGIQSVYKKACELGAFDLILIDECHLLQESGEGMYRTFLKEAKIVNPNVRLIGFTATPYRLSTGLICKPENLLNHVCYEKGIKELINEGYLCRIHTKVPAKKIDCSGLHVRNGEFRADDVAELFSSEAAVHSIFADIFRNTKDRNKILIFCADVAQAVLFQREIQRIADVGLITGETPANERAELIARFQDKPTGLLQQVEPLRWLVNVNVLTTGFDAPNIDCVVLARPTLSPGLYYQMCLDMDTEVLTPYGWRRCHEIAKGDIVGTFDTETEEIVYVAAEDKVHRALRRDESMYGVLSPRLDIRVTNNHNMLIRCPKAISWKLQTAESIATRKNGYLIPIAGRGKHCSNEANLSDAEVAFLGWYLTDGYRNPLNGTIAISQSVIKFHDEVRRVLTECDFGFREYRQERQGDLAHYEDRLAFVIPYGKPRGEQQGKSGWSYLEEWIDKDMPALYDTLSKRQFSILIDAMNKANGRHCKTLDYTPRTMTIFCGCRRRLADRIQQLAIERGFRCDVRSFCFKPSKWNRTPQIQWCIAIREKSTAFVGGTRIDKNELIPNRCRFGSVPFTPNEWVWCLTTEKGTLVTRRNGKVAILGNCGRGLRLAPNKTDCLVLDYGGNIQRHGCIDAIRIKTKSGGIGGEAPIRECPECHTILSINVSRCAGCGYVFPMPEPESKLETSASKDGILSGQIKETEYEVLNVSYSKHHKKGGTPDDPPTLRVDYEVGINTFVQKWVCPEHKGWAWSNKFVPWWTKRTDIKPPTTVDEALHYVNYLAVPQRITVIETAGQRFAEILEHDFSDKPESPESGYAPAQTCGDCALFYKGDCPYRTGMFGEEPACEHFLEPRNAELVDKDVPF